MEMDIEKKTPHPADVYAGKALRKFRILNSFSQEQLGTLVNLTFQQIQKYERGENRMGCSRLSEFARVLKVSPLEFFAESERDPSGVPADSLRLMRYFGYIKEAGERDVVITVARCLSGYDKIEGVVPCPI